MTKLPGKKILIRWVRNYRMSWNKSEGSFIYILKFLESHKDYARAVAMPGSTHKGRQCSSRVTGLGKVGFWGNDCLDCPFSLERKRVKRHTHRWYWVRGRSGPGKKELKIAECKIREYLGKGKGKRKETAKMGSGNESGEREESTNGKKSGLIKEGQSLEWKRRVKESPS